MSPDVEKQKEQSGNCREGTKKRKHLLLGITGGVAAYKAAELARLLTRAGIVVQTVMTASACRFVGPVTFQSLTGQPVYTELWETNAANNMAHIQLSRNTDMILIAPASADFIAKLAGGMADDLLSTLCLARDCPLMVAPAMNRQMWINPATQRNIQRLLDDGIRIVGPVSGEQACGEVGMGRMFEAHALLETVQEALNDSSAIIPQLRQKHVLITAGPTYEPIDPVRGITNLSSGKMGYAIAQAALNAGAKVTLISGPVCLTPPAAAQTIHVLSALDMFNAVDAEIAGTDIFIGVAAVADYRVATASAQKIKKSDQKIQLELLLNPDILQHVADRDNPPFCVGFAAETDHLEQYAARKRTQKKLSLLVANQAQETLGADEAALVLFDDTGKRYFAKAAKSVQARKLIEHIAVLYAQQHQ
ncbi:MAG: bifunctional phosphopantothenoylcysteine decarboxylase/phosphopantothenate--cysteine ligase CoaBC [Nitrosomonas sp.]|nr:bifunctional phosphopantothenoylcysteine decarboxylase/phosphopantothenate--cysteine ligase CoaBC [Nitrosomonas sp.]